MKLLIALLVALALCAAEKCDEDKNKKCTTFQNEADCMDSKETCQWCRNEDNEKSACTMNPESECTMQIAGANGQMEDYTVKPSMCGGCFPATATVRLANNKTKTLDQLTIGDKVHVGQDQFSEVYYFSTQLTETTSKFVKISTSQTSSPLLMTPGHYLYVNGKLAQARSVQSGDILTLGDGSKIAVQEVGEAWAPGLYNPHTMTGDIVIDDVLTSTYTDAVHPTLAHAVLLPLRTLYQAGMTFGQDFNQFAKNLPSWILDTIRA